MILRKEATNYVNVQAIKVLSIILRPKFLLFSL